MGIYNNVLFPTCYDAIMKGANLDARRAQALTSVRGRVLEVGIGTGLNLEHYPENVDGITALDPNPGMAKQLKKRVARLPIDVDLVVGPAEDMPFADQSFDTVVTTHVICSLDDIAQALAEIRRVLAPQGRLVFLEHGLSADDNIRKWQRRLNPVQKLWGGGCRLDVDVPRVLEAAGFGVDGMTEGYLAGQPKTHGYLYEGVAAAVES